MHRRGFAALLLVGLLLPWGHAQADSPFLAALPDPLSLASAVVLDGVVYLLGGTHGATHSSGIYRFDPVNRTTTRVATLPGSADAAPDGGRLAPAAFALGGKIYVAGGAARVAGTGPFPFVTRALADVLEFDPVTNVVRSTTDRLPSARYGIASAVVDGRAYLVGGGGDGVDTDVNGPREILVFDPSRPEGARVSVHVTGLPASLRNARAVAGSDTIHVVGGTVHGGSGEWACPQRASGPTVTTCLTPNVARFDPASGAFSVVAKLPIAMSNVEVGRLGGAIFLVGGEGQGYGTEENVTRLDLATGAIARREGRTHLTTSAGATAVVDDVLYRFGGRLANDSTPRRDVRMFYGDLRPPGAPLALFARPEGNATFVSWLAPSDGGGGAPIYRLERIENGTVTLIHEGNATNATDATTPGAQLRYRVRAMQGALAGPVVETVAVAGQAPPPAIANARAWAGATSARLAWDPVGPNVTGIAIDRDGAFLALVAPTATGHTDPDVGGTYVLRVRVGDVEGEPVVLTPAPIPAPSGLVAGLTVRETRAGYRLVLAWTGEANATYEVLSGASADALAVAATTTGPRWEDARIAPGTRAWFSVRLVDAGLSGANAPPILIDAPAAPPAPSWLHANASESSIALAWEPVAAADATYTLWRTGADGLERPLAENVTATSFLDADVERSIQYGYRVTTEAALRSSFSPEARATLGVVAEPTPTTPSRVTPPPVTTSTLATPSATAPTTPPPTPTHVDPPPVGTPSGSPIGEFAPTPAQTPGSALVLALVALAFAAFSRRR